jgi:hypothetical protein
MRKRNEAGDRDSANGAEQAEAMGIVISNGARHEDPPRFAAYVWGPAPESELREELVAVA